MQEIQTYEKLGLQYGAVFYIVKQYNTSLLLDYSKTY